MGRAMGREGEMGLAIEKREWRSVKGVAQERMRARRREVGEGGLCLGDEGEDGDECLGVDGSA